MTESGTNIPHPSPPEVFVDDLTFPESPRWHNGQLWFVDMFGQRVLTADVYGHTTTVAEFSERVSGLGFLPDGTGIVGLMFKNHIVRMNDGSLFADLTDLGSWYLNDMVVDTQGRAYVDVIQEGDGFRTSRDVGDSVALVEVDGSHKVVAQGGVIRPNGLALTPDNGTLIVGMSRTHTLMSYSIEGDGTLTSPTEFANTGDELIDGICLDEEGFVWFASPPTGKFSRINSRSQIVDQVSVGSSHALACTLGGADRRTLYMATTVVPSNPFIRERETNLTESHGSIQVANVEVPGAGIP